MRGFFKRHWKALCFSMVAILLAGLVFWLKITKTVNPSTLSKKTALRLVPQLPDILDRVLKPVVDQNGLVDYRKLQQTHRELDRFLAVVARVSPVSDPTLFPTREARLAYWINAYNASVLKNVLLFPGWKDMFSHWRKVRFFAAHRFVYGGAKWNLLALENKWMRPRFKEALIHFAINCASFGCPNLPQKAFRAKGLQQRLELEARKFFALKRNVRMDSKTKTVYLSSILFWFRNDFVKWGLQSRRNKGWKLAKGQDGLLVYINQFRAKGQQVPTRGWKIRFVEYDWRLNSQHGPSRNSPLRR